MHQGRLQQVQREQLLKQPWQSFSPQQQGLPRAHKDPETLDSEAQADGVVASYISKVTEIVKTVSGTEKESARFGSIEARVGMHRRAVERVSGAGSRIDTDEALAYYRELLIRCGAELSAVARPPAL